MNVRPRALIPAMELACVLTEAVLAAVNPVIDGKDAAEVTEAVSAAMIAIMLAPSNGSPQVASFILRSLAARMISYAELHFPSAQPSPDCHALLGLLLDKVDYTRGKCRLNDSIGIVLPLGVISRCRAELDRGG